MENNSDLLIHELDMWRSMGKGVLNKTIDVKVQAQKCLNFDVKRFVKYSFSYGTSHILLDRQYIGGGKSDQ